MAGHLVGHLVAFEDVGEGVDVEAETVRHMNQHIDLGLHIGMAGDEALAVEHLQHGLMHQVPARRRGGAAHGAAEVVVSLPLARVFLGLA